MFNIEIIIYLGTFFGLYFAVFVLGTFLENKKEIYRNPAVSYFPLVALIVPAFNEEKTISRTIESIQNLDYPNEKLEIIVVDDGSADKTFAKAEKFAREDNRIKILQKQNGGKHTAMNLGMSQTKADFIGSVDADSYLEPSALKKITAYFKNLETKAVVSTIKIGRAKKIIEKIQRTEFILAAFLRKNFSVLESVNVAPGPLSVFRREVFEKLGPYRKGHQTEDLELAFRMQSAHYKIAHAHEAIVYTQACSNFFSLTRQRLRWRRGFILNLRDYPELLNFSKHGNLSFLLFPALSEVLFQSFCFFTFFTASALSQRKKSIS